MKNALKDAALISKYAMPMSGVFSVGDLKRLFGESSAGMLHRRIRRLEDGGIISRFMRGMYVTNGFSGVHLAARIIEKSYISMGTVLAREMMTGSVPAKTIYAVRIGKSRVFRGKGLTIEYLGIAADLFFGYRLEQGIRFARPEKALLDVLYFHLHGSAFSFDVYHDIDISRIDYALIESWLVKYRNQRFISFVRGYLSERH